MSDATGLVLSPKRVPAEQPVKTLAPILRSSREKMNQYRQKAMPTKFSKILNQPAASWTQHDVMTSPHVISFSSSGL